MKQLAELHNISPETLKNWIEGEKPKAGYDGFLCYEIFSKFSFKDDLWHPLTPQAERLLNSVITKQ